MKATIIGAGNTGFACAADLARHHITTTVYSRDPAKAAKSKWTPSSQAASQLPSL